MMNCNLQTVAAVERRVLPRVPNRSQPASQPGHAPNPAPVRRHSSESQPTGRHRVVWGMQGTAGGGVPFQKGQLPNPE